MTHDTREVEEVVYALFVEHIEDLMNEAEMAVRYEVKDKEQYYERLRTGSRSLVDAIRTTLHHQLQKAREEERERIEAIFKEHVPPHALDLEDSVWLKRLLNKAFNHDKNI